MEGIFGNKRRGKRREKRVEKSKKVKKTNDTK